MSNTVELDEFVVNKDLSREEHRINQEILHLFGIPAPTECHEYEFNAALLELYTASCYGTTAPPFRKALPILQKVYQEYLQVLSGELSSKSEAVINRLIRNGFRSYLCLWYDLDEGDCYMRHLAHQIETGRMTVEHAINCHQYKLPNDPKNRNPI